MNPRRVAWVTGFGIIVVVGLFVTAGTDATPEGSNRFLEILAATAFLGGPLALAGAFMAYRLASAARGLDFAERVLALATVDGHERREVWARAMRAELASIEDSRDRRRYALGCFMTTLRLGMGWVPWAIAIGIGVALALGTFVTSRVSLAGARTGIIGFTLPGPILILFGVAFIRVRAARSFRSGLIIGGLALITGLIGVLAVAMLEAARWYEIAGVFVMDGDAPKGGLERLEAIRDPISWPFLIFHLLIWVPWPVLGAAAAALQRHRPATEARSAATFGI
jgi:hypothetical protein